jgi:hypothetical protein
MLLTTSFQNVSAPALPAVVSVIHIVNTTAGSATVQMSLVAGNETPSESNALLWDFNIPANDFIEFGEGITIPVRYSIKTKVSADNTLAITVSYK